MIRVRFAPSPTGHLHLGNVRTALFNYFYAKGKQGQFILRIEDTDRERSKEEYLQSQIRDLSWMGIRWDEGPYRQSERLEFYKEHIRKLVEEGKAYACYVTDSEIQGMRQQAMRQKKSFHFDNRGRFFSEEEIRKRIDMGVRPTIRFRIDDPVLSFHDLIRGEVCFDLSEMTGDFIIQRSDGQPTFHLAVCVDDALMKVTHVIRGEDHLPNTPKHILLLKAMGYKPPEYGHLSLVHGPGGEPLSKRLSAVSVQAFRKEGYLPEALGNYIALLGWAPGDDREVFGWEDLIRTFDLSRVNRSASNFDPDKLRWMNGEHLRKLDPVVYARRALQFLDEETDVFARGYTREEVISMLPVFQDKIQVFSELPDQLKILEDTFDYEAPEILEDPAGKSVVETALKILPEISFQEEEPYAIFIEKIKPCVSVKGKALFHPLRMALTGRLSGPEMKRFFGKLGPDKLKKRLERAKALTGGAD